MDQIHNMTVSDLEKALEVRKARLGVLLSKRLKILRKIDGLDERIKGIAGRSGNESSSVHVSKRSVKRQRAVGQPPLRVWIRDELAKARKGLTVDELITRVITAGYRTSSEKFKNVVYQNLFHGEIFQRDAVTGRWLLVVK